jgi:hypothetical protein
LLTRAGGILVRSAGLYAERGNTMRSFFASLLIILGSVSCALAASAKVERIDRPASPAIPETIWKVLDPKGYRITSDDGSQICDLWLRRNTPQSRSKEPESALYPELAASTMVGAISFPKATTDYKGDAVLAGVYTLRYELLPADGNHLGVAPNPDFVLLIPASADPDPSAQFRAQELINLSRKATGSQHPAPLSLVQAGNSDIAKDDQDHWIFSGKLGMADGSELSFGLVVKGMAPQ